jgi:hypothetical protein
MTEFLLVAENVTETEDADFVLYFGENLSFVPDYADWTWSDTLRSPFKVYHGNSILCHVCFGLTGTDIMCSSSKYFCGFFFPLRNVIDTLVVYSDEVLSQVSSVYRVPICPFLAVCLWRLHS